MQRVAQYAMLGIAVVALGLAAHLTFGSSSSGFALAGCGPESGCEEVLSSGWARWFGAPVSMLAIVVYAIVLTASSLLHFSHSGRLRWSAWVVLLVASLSASGAAIWFLGLQLFLIGSFCPVCVAIHICSLTLTFLVFWVAPIGVDLTTRGTSKNLAPAITTKQLGWSAMAAMCGVGLLISGQILIGASQHEVIELTTAAHSRADETLGLLRVGEQELDCREFPVLGSLAAPHVLVEFFDYTCPKCRSMHGYLQAASQRYGDQIAVVLIPTPYDSQCNPTVKTGRTHACEYAGLALAVWRAAPARFSEYHDWLHTGAKLPEIHQAKSFASELVGQQALNQAIQETQNLEIVAQALALNDNVFRTAKANGGMCGDAVPKIAIGSDRVLAGLPATVDEFLADLQQTLGLQAAEDLLLEQKGLERWNVKVTGSTVEFGPD